MYRLAQGLDRWNEPPIKSVIRTVKQVKNGAFSLDFLSEFLSSKNRSVIYIPLFRCGYGPRQMKCPTFGKQ
jgi:hypothetical protein